MSQYTVICHRCGKSTFVDLSRTISDQRCRACRGFLQGVDVSIGDKHLESRRKLVVKVAGAAGREPEWHDQETPVIPIRQRWPRYYRWVMWSGLLGFLTAIGLAAMRKFRTTLGGHREVIVQQVRAPTDVRLTEPWRVKATTLAERALAISEIEELLPLLYHPEVSDDVIRRYYATEETLPLGTDLVKEYYIPPGDSAENAVAFWFTDSAQRRRAFVIVEKPKGMVIDWPSLTGFGEMPLKQYLRTMPPGVVVLRARARIGHYYNHYFADSSKWLSIRLSDVTDENAFHGYVDRSLTIADAMETSFPSPEAGRDIPDKPVIVVLKHPPGNVQSDQTQIISLLATSWYYSGGLQPLIEQARKEDAVRTGLSSAEEGNVETPAPPDKPPGESPPPAPEPAPPAPGSQP